MMDSNTFRKVGAALAATLSISAAGYMATAQRESPGGVPPTVAYQDIGGVWTICHGKTNGVTRGMRTAPGQCEVWLRDELDGEYGRAVGRLVKQPISQAQYDVLVDFAYNKGVNAFAKSTLLKKTNAGDCRGASAEFLKWDKVCKVINGRKSCRAVKGLTTAAMGWKTKFEAGCENHGDDAGRQVAHTEAARGMARRIAPGQQPAGG